MDVVMWTLSSDFPLSWASLLLSRVHVHLSPQNIRLHGFSPMMWGSWMFFFFFFYFLLTSKPVSPHLTIRTIWRLKSDRISWIDCYSSTKPLNSLTNEVFVVTVLTTIFVSDLLCSTKVLTSNPTYWMKPIRTDFHLSPLLQISLTHPFIPLASSVLISLHFHLCQSQRNVFQLPATAGTLLF